MKTGLVYSNVPLLAMLIVLKLEFYRDLIHVGSYVSFMFEMGMVKMIVKMMVVLINFCYGMQVCIWFLLNKEDSK